jgi:hypothetical protein
MRAIVGSGLKVPELVLEERKTGKLPGMQRFQQVDHLQTYIATIGQLRTMGAGADREAQ